MTGRRTLAAALVGAVLAAVGGSAGLLSAPARAATPDVTVVVAPDGGGIVRDGKGIGVDVTVTDTGSDALSAGRITFSLDTAPVANIAELTSTIADPPEALQGQLASASVSVPALAAAQRRTVRATISSKDLTDLLSGASGASRLYVQYSAGSGTSAVKRIAVSSLVKVASSARAAVRLGAVIPLLAPANASGLVDVGTQGDLTADGGAWTRALQAADADPDATIALDPEVLASIRIAGDAAPASATAFLEQLGGLPNEFVRLPYGDTDVTLARAAGAAKDLDPTSFAGVTPAQSGTGPTPAPTATRGASSEPQSDLTAWTWSDRKVAWPVPHTASSADVAGLAARGDQVLLPSDDLQGSTAGHDAGPVARIGSADVLVSDATVSSLLASASAGGETGDAALATLTGVLATAAFSGETGAVLATIGRSGAPGGLGRVLGLLGSQRWIRSSTLADLGAAGGGQEVRLQSRSVPTAAVSTARSLLAGERQVRQLGTAVIGGQDATVTAPQHLTLLGTMSAAWRADPAGWRAAASSAEQGFAKVLGRVQLAKQSSPNLVGGDGTLAVYVINGLPAPVRVVVNAGVSNGAVQFTNSSATVIVPAGGRAKAEMAFRSIRNGQTDLTLSLTTPNGTPIGSEVTRGATVRAGFDTIVAVGLLIALGLLLALGIYRNIARRRHPKAAAA